MEKSKKQVRVDYNEKMILQDKLGREGKMDAAEQYRVKMEALQEIKDSGIDYCSCPEACPHHGKCWECVLIHRGHRDHLPYCFWDMINESAKNGVTVFVTTHYMDEAEYCDRVSIMVDGRIEDLDSPAALKQKYGVENMDGVFTLLAGRAERGE